MLEVSLQDFAFDKSQEFYKDGLSQSSASIDISALALKPCCVGAKRNSASTVSRAVPSVLHTPNNKAGVLCKA